MRKGGIDGGGGEEVGGRWWMGECESGPVEAEGAVFAPMSELVGWVMTKRTGVSSGDGYAAVMGGMIGIEAVRGSRVRCYALQDGWLEMIGSNGLNSHLWVVLFFGLVAQVRSESSYKITSRQRHGNIHNQRETKVIKSYIS